MECNEVFSVSRSAMLGRKHGWHSAGRKEMDRMLWNSPPVGSLQSNVPQSNGPAERGDGEAGSRDARRQNTTAAVRYRTHLQDDDEAPGSPVELCDVAVLKITDATTTSVGPAPSTVLTEVTAESTAAASPPPTPTSVDTAGTDDNRRRLRRWLDLCHCERHLTAIKVYYFTFIGALGVAIAYAVIFLKQIGLSPLEIGVISGVRPVLGFVSAPAWGAVADRYNIRRFLMFASMGAWLAFYSGLYFVEAPARRTGFSDDGNVVEQAVAATEASNMTVTPNASTSGTFVDVGLYMTRQNSSIAATMTSTASNVVASSWSSACDWNMTDSGSLRPTAEQERMREDLSWLYEPDGAYRVFIICLVIICGGELFQSPTTAMSDAATLQILGRDQLEKYGAQRAWGPLGWAASTLFTGAVLNAHRHNEDVCGVRLVFTDYRVVTYIFIATFAVSLGAAVKINFATKKADQDVNNESGSRDGGKDKAAKKDRTHNTLAVIRVFLNVRNGSWILTILFIGTCNGLIWGFLFWHLDNLGASQLMMGVDMVVACVFEFFAYFIVDYFVRLVGHAGIMYVGLLGYALRFVVYAAIRNPWTVLPVETLQGVTFAFTWVSMSQYTAISVPTVSLATVQGIIHGVYFGLGNGIGHLFGGLAIDAYGAPATFYAASLFVVLWFIIFLVCQKLSRTPVDQFAYQDMDVNSDVTSVSGVSTLGSVSRD